MRLGLGVPPVLSDYLRGEHYEDVNSDAPRTSCLVCTRPLLRGYRRPGTKYALECPKCRLEHDRLDKSLHRQWKRFVGDVRAGSTMRWFSFDVRGKKEREARIREYKKKARLVTAILRAKRDANLSLFDPLDMVCEAYDVAVLGLE